MDLSKLLGNISASSQLGMDLQQGVPDAKVFERELETQEVKMPVKDIKKNPLPNQASNESPDSKKIEAPKPKGEPAPRMENESDEDAEMASEQAGVSIAQESTEPALANDETAKTDEVVEAMVSKLEITSEPVAQIAPQVLALIQALDQNPKAQGGLPKQIQQLLGDIEVDPNLSVQSEMAPEAIAQNSQKIQNLASQLQSIKPEQMQKVLQQVELPVEVKAEIQKQMSAELVKDDKVEIKGVSPEIQVAKPEVAQAVIQPSKAIPVSKPIAKTKVEQLIKESSSTIGMRSKLLDSEMKNINENVKLSEESVGAKPSSLKHLADGLFIQKGLEGQVDSAMAALRAGSSKFSVSSEPADLKLVQKHLTDDMKAIVSRALITKEGGQMSLSLRPGNMGEVRIDLQIKNDSVHVRMEAENSGAQQVLKQNVSDLKTQLQASGLKIEDIQISSSRAQTSNEQKSFQSYQDQRQQHSSQRDASGQEKSTADSSLAKFDGIFAERSVA
ncbi:MAG: hypothetical protein COV44_07675 [Deltaproteobacteria bacterium CG11_big_fil_rev_8_21_14_0_20_45_16]|nr:MAG: hypothetical protein COV44_07675 [Deltaproteobacteria bacterium CG11_big_fil_rev_8_21_14_0_20_45_16]